MHNYKQLIQAIYDNDPQKCAQLLAQDESLVYLHEEDRCTPLHIAAQLDRKVIACILMSYNATNQLKNVQNQTPSEYAKQHYNDAISDMIRGETDFGKALRQEAMHKITSLNLQKSLVQQKTSDSQSYHPLFTNAQCDLFLNPPKTTPPKTSQEKIFDAIQKGDHEGKCCIGHTELRLTRTYDHVNPILDILTEEAPNGQNALHFACQHDRVETVKLILEKGVSPFLHTHGNHLNGLSALDFVQNKNTIQANEIRALLNEITAQHKRKRTQ